MQIIKYKKLFWIVLLINILLIAGCSSTPKPVGEIAGAEAKIEAAKANDAAEFAPVELDRAKSKLRNAQKAMNEDENLKAKWLADEAQSDAKLATMKASSTRAKRATENMRQTVEGMKSEIERIQTR